MMSKVETDRSLGGPAHQVIQEARRHNITVYDAKYLTVAVRQGLPLVTMDERLKKAAERAGVPEFV